MPKDLREMLQNEISNTEKLSKNHRKNFEARLQKELHDPKKKSNRFLKIAASFIVVVGLGSSLFYFLDDVAEQSSPTAKIENLGSISPELKSIESYYLASINTEILQLQETPENKELIDGYLEKIGELTTDYKLLTAELNSDGLSEKTITALIENLQLRLKLLYQLNEQLNELKELNTQENGNIQV